MNNYEADWDHDFPAFQAQSRIAVFYQTTRDLQSIFSPLTTGFARDGSFLLFTGNVGNSDELGAEFSLQGRLGAAWRWSLGYSPRIVHDDFYTGASTANTAIDFAHTTPRHVFKGSLGWSKGPWELDGFLSAQSSAAGLAFSPPQNLTLVPFGSVVSFDARAAYRITPNLTLSLLGDNVLFSSARQNSFSKVEQQYIGQLTAHF